MTNNFITLSPLTESHIKSQRVVDAASASEMSVVNLMTVVAERAKGSRLAPLFFQHNEVLLKEIASRINVSVTQAILIAVIAEIDGGVNIRSIAKYLECGSIAVHAYEEELADLVARRILTLDNGCRNHDYRLSRGASSAYIKGEAYTYRVPENLTLDKMFGTIGTILIDYSHFSSDDCYNPLWEKVEELFQHNTHLPMTLAILDEVNLTPFQRMVLICLAHALYTSNRISVSEDTLSRLLDFGEHYSYEEDDELDKLKHLGLIEHKCEDGMENRTSYSLTLNACRTLFPGMGLETSLNTLYSAGCIDPSTLIAKQLFYNAEDASQVEQLTDLLKEENFREVCTRLKEDGFRQGFCCLFYGAPGTGKTETVYQLARATGRSIITLNVNDIMSKWVGDSEKNIKAVFTNYRDKVRHLDRAPILFLNEADSIIHRRIENIQDSVDQMSNSIQNIVLQEMENFEGILIAATNLAKNFDRAFDRRFLYKIEFHAPDSETQSHIWTSMLPTLTLEDAQSITADYSFTGGEIENIVRKAKVNHILTGTICDLAAIRNICAHEIINTADASKKKVGF